MKRNIFSLEEFYMACSKLPSMYYFCCRSSHPTSGRWFWARDSGTEWPPKCWTSLWQLLKDVRQGEGWYSVIVWIPCNGCHGCIVYIIPIVYLALKHYFMIPSENSTHQLISNCTSGLTAKSWRSCALRYVPVLHELTLSTFDCMGMHFCQWLW